MSRIVTLAALLLATSSSLALAGGPAAVEAEPVVIEPVAASSAGLGTAGIIGGVVLLALALGLGDDDDTTTTTTTTRSR